MSALVLRPLLPRLAFVRAFSTPAKGKPSVHLNVGTIGHVDHGKTTLSSALTKVSNKLHPKISKYVPFENIDKAEQESVRGITINASHIEYYGLSKHRHYAHTDCPGHADFIKNMICGASQMDAAILVVAASEGSMPQTREHLLLSKQIGIKQIITYVNKCDLVDDEMKLLTEMEIRDQLNSFGWNGDSAPFVFGSALAALGDDESEIGIPSIKKLLEILDNQISPPERDTSSPFLMFLDSKITIPGRGTAAIGTVNRGTLKRMDPVEILGFGEKIKSVVTDIHMFGKSYPECKSGDHISVLLRGIKLDNLRRGMAITAAESLTMNNRFEANMYLLSKEEGGKQSPIGKHYVQSILAHTWSIGCRIDVPTSLGGLLMPGDTGTVHITLPRLMPLLVGDSFTVSTFRTLDFVLTMFLQIRQRGSQTVASGVITQLLPPIEKPAEFLLGKFNLDTEYGPPTEEDKSSLA